MDTTATLQTEIDAAEGAYRAGRGSLADLLSARAASVALEDRTSDLSRKVRAAKIALARWLGDGLSLGAVRVP